MNLLVSVDDNYYKPLFIMLTSFMENNPSSNIYLLYRRLADNKIDELQRQIERYGHHFFPIRIDPTAIEELTLQNELPIETYFRLFAIEYLPIQIEKVLYLDADIIVDGSLEQFYDTDFENQYFIGVPDFGVRHWYHETNARLQLPKDFEYINAGVLLMNLKLLRQDINLQQLCAFIVENTDLLLWSDQDVINMLYYHKIKHISSNYNYQARFYKLYQVLTYPLTSLIKKPTILHYVCPIKPWEDGYYGKYLKRYCHYAKKAGLPSGEELTAMQWLKYIRQKLKADLQEFQSK